MPSEPAATSSRARHFSRPRLGRAQVYLASSAASAPAAALPGSGRVSSRGIAFHGAERVFLRFAEARACDAVAKRRRSQGSLWPAEIPGDAMHAWPGRAGESAYDVALHVGDDNLRSVTLNA